MAGHTGRRVQRTHGPMLGLLVGCALWAALGGAAWAKPKPVLILPFQSSTETDAWFGEAIAETLFVASQRLGNWCTPSKAQISKLNFQTPCFAKAPS